MNHKIERFLYPTRLKRKLAFGLFDLISFFISLYLSFSIRSDFKSIIPTYNEFFVIFLIFSGVKLVVFHYYKLYDVSWKLISIHDLVTLIKASVISNVILFIFIYGTNYQLFDGFPRSLLLTDMVFTFLLTAGFKFSKRIYLEVMRRNISQANKKRALIVGAGHSAEQLMRDMNRSSATSINPICFVDDDQNKQALRIFGIPVLGSIYDIPEIVKKYKIETIVISILTADRDFHRKILKIAHESNIYDVKVISTINDISNLQKVKVEDIRDISVSDLIGRQAVAINTKDIIKYIKGKRVLVTGAAGSIGYEICRQISLYHPSEICILDINESDLVNLELDLNGMPNPCSISMVLCDISDRKRLNSIFDDFKPEVVFHAAAYKHVPVMEKFPEEAVRVNIVGTYNLAMAALKNECKNFVLISTDKAVNPTSIMGVTKRIAEIIVTSIGQKSTANFVSVRFGNVIGSRGSVLPIFLDQIRKGGPITITHPDMKRYFMSIPESVALVLQATTAGKSGDIFILDMGAPVKILDIARDLILLNNLIPDKDIKIEFTGIRDGEKLFEEILTEDEGILATSHKKIFKTSIDSEKTINDLETFMNDIFVMLEVSDKTGWINFFRKIVPGFTSGYLKSHEPESYTSKILPIK